MVAIGALGYVVVGVLYALLSVLLLVTWRGNRIAILLIAAVSVSAVWGFGLASQTAFGNLNPLAVSILETLRATAWLAFLVRLASQIGVSRALRTLALAACVFVITGLLLLGTRQASDPSMIVIVDKALIPGGLMIALFGLVMIEQLYRNSSIESKYLLKPLVFGIGGIFAYDLFLYSQGVLLNAIDPTTWLARGAVNALFVPMIAIAARRNTDWKVRIFVSRQVVFYSTTLTAAGVYLLLMSLGGYLIVRYGGTWGGLAQIVFFAGAGVVLVSLLFSNTLRSRLRVFLNKHFFHNKYDYREEWLRLVATLGDFDARAGRDVAVQAIAQIVDSPAGAIWVRDDANSDFKCTARYETDHDFPDFESDASIIRFIEKDWWLIDFVELREYPGRYGELKIPEWLQNRDAAWLLVPLQSEGDFLGLILLYKAPGPPRLNFEDRDLLKTVGNHIAVHLAQARADSMLAEAKQFEAYNRLTTFLMHDLNNLVAQQSLIVTNAEKHKRNPEFVDDAIGTIASSVERMKRVMRMLKSGGADSAARSTALKFIVSAAVDRCAAGKPTPTLKLNGVEASVKVNAEEFTMVLAHLIRNAQDACASGGQVDVSLGERDGIAEICVADTGDGMTAEFIRSRLFRPFDSTKGAQGMGIGAYQAREFARKLGGELQVESAVGEGSRFKLTIPTGGS